MKTLIALLLCAVAMEQNSISQVYYYPRNPVLYYPNYPTTALLPTLSIVRRDSLVIELAVRGRPGVIYCIQSSNDLKTWSEIVKVRTDWSGKNIIMVLLEDSSHMRFFRLAQ